MGFVGEKASGDSLVWLQNSSSIKEFEGEIQTRAIESVDPQTIDIERRGWVPKRVIAIDGSNVAHKVQNGFPGADASLLMISVVRIDLTKLVSSSNEEMTMPHVFRDMEDARTVDAVLPGANIVRKSVSDDTPLRYFRDEVFKTLERGTVSQGHETLLETLYAIVGDRESSIKCPIEDCTRTGLNVDKGVTACPCGNGRLLYTDTLRLFERFNDLGSNGEVHGEYRHLVEVLVLLNILRYFANKKRAHFLSECAFVLDGPLAMFGHTAWLTKNIKDELKRINTIVRDETGQDMALFGLEKSGQFVAHFEDIDWCDGSGPRGKIPNGTVIAPTKRYVHRNIVFRPDNAKPHGKDTYFGRKILYKTRSSNHAVLNCAMLNDASDDFDRNDPSCYPRLGDILDIMDHLSTYLYQDGFMPLVRAHAHAAIPLQKGTDILSSLFEDS